MKFIEKSSYFILAIIIASLLTGCKDNSVTPNKNTSKADLDIGKWHNKSVEMLSSDENAMNSMNNYPKLQKILIQKLSEKNPKTFSAQKLEDKIGKVNKSLVSSGILRISNPSKSGNINYSNLSNTETEFTNNFQEAFRHLLEKEKISKRFYNKLYSLYQKVSEGNIPNNKVEFATNHFSDTDWSHEEESLIDNFVETLKSSNKHWNKSMNKSTNPTIQCSDEAIIWSDAAGALYGSTVSGPYGIVTGAIASTMVVANEDVGNC
jgi:hypothetical protein